MSAIMGLGDTLEESLVCGNVNATNIFLTKSSVTIGDYSFGTDDVQKQIEKLAGALNTRTRSETLIGILEIHGANLGTDSLIDDYLQPMIPMIAPWIALGAIALLAAIPVCWIRCCCAKKCCRPKKALTAYAASCNLIYALAYVILTGAACILSVVAIGNMGRIYDGALGFTCETEVLRNNSINFFQELHVPVSNIESEANSLIAKVEDAITQSYGAVDTLTQVQAELGNFSSGVANIKMPDPIVIPTGPSTSKRSHLRAI